MANALPAARVLLGDARGGDADVLRDAAAELSRTLLDPAGKVTDGFGHHRPVYPLLAIHLFEMAARLLGDDGVLGYTDDAAEALYRWAETTRGIDPRLLIWLRLIATQQGVDGFKGLPPEAAGAQPLVPIGMEDLIDAWTYHELVGLHGLHLCALIEDDPSLSGRARSAAMYHLTHTQPDYTTYQPWALAAFASDPATALFAEQQLHDVATHLRLEGPGGAVLPALLLADAAATMAGTIRRAW